MRCLQRGGGAYRRSAQRITAAQSSFIEQRAGLKRPVESDRRSLLLGTALASTLLMGTLAAPTPAAALTCAVYVGTGPAPISLLNTNDSIICVNTEARANAAGNAIELGTYNADHSISLNSSGALTASNGASAFGIFATTDGTNSPIDVVNSGDIWTRVTSGYAIGVGAISNSSDSPIGIDNSGDLSIDAGQDGMGIRSQASGGSATVTNTGKIAVSSGNHAFGIFAQAASMTSIVNSGDITAMSDMAYAAGVFAASYTSEVSISNSGNIAAEGGVQAMGLFAQTAGGPATIVNSGDLTVSAGVNAAVGILGQTYGPGGSISIKNSGNISVSSPERYAGGLVGITQRDDSSVSITNSGNITATDARLIAAGIYASTIGANSSITIKNSGSLSATGQSNAFGILAKAYGPNSTISIVNSGSVYGTNAGVYATSATSVIITNTGSIEGGLGPAIFVVSGSVEIRNSGHIAGYVALDAEDRFINHAGAVFEARQTSDFDAYGGGGADLFINQSGATVHTANDAAVAETASFVNLETFQNQGLISLVDGGTGDQFILSSRPIGTGLNFVASGNSTLAVDAFLGGPGSTSDTFKINGNVSGTTTVAVNNLNTGPGVFNPVGMRVVTVTGTTPNPNAFHLAEPIDRGFFDYDLFFTPTGSGYWDLRSFTGAGAYLLPQLVTAAQDIWHQGSSTWFDRTADLRVLLNGGAAPAYEGGKSLGDGAPTNFTPATWVRGSGGWLDRNDSAK